MTLPVATSKAANSVAVPIRRPRSSSAATVGSGPAPIWLFLVHAQHQVPPADPGRGQRRRAPSPRSASVESLKLCDKWGCTKSRGMPSSADRLRTLQCVAFLGRRFRVASRKRRRLAGSAGASDSPARRSLASTPPLGAPSAGSSGDVGDLRPGQPRRAIQHDPRPKRSRTLRRPPTLKPVRTILAAASSHADTLESMVSPLNSNPAP